MNSRLRPWGLVMLAVALNALVSRPVLAKGQSADGAADGAAAEKKAAEKKDAAAGKRPAGEARRRAPVVPSGTAAVPAQAKPVGARPPEAQPAPGNGTPTPFAPAGGPPPGPNAQPQPYQPPTPPPGGGMAGAGNPSMEELSSDADLYRCKNLPKRAKFKVTLKPETELKDLVQWAMSFTCRNFIFGQGITGRASKVTIIAPSEMTPGEAWNLFLVSLQTMNLNVVPKGQTLEIVDAQQARDKPLPVYGQRGAPDSDQIVRAVLRPENISVDDLGQVCNSLKSSGGTCQPIPTMGVVIVTDYGASIQKMVQMLRMVDVPNDGEKIYILPVRNADATEMVGKLTEIFGSRQGGGGAPPPAAQPRPAPTKATATTAGRQPTVPQNTPTPAPTGGGADVDVSAVPSKIIADERTNSIIAVASDAAYRRLAALVSILDTAVEGGEGRIHVYALANADAEEMATTLGSLVSGGTTPQRGGQGGPGGQRNPNTPQVQAPSSPGSGTAAFEGQVKISFDKPSNSLVIVSSQKDYLSLKQVILQLDRPRRQVFIEATIMEVSLDKTRKLGFAWHGGKPYEVAGKDAILVGGVQHGQLGTLALNPANLVGGIGGGFGQPITEANQILGISIPSVGLLFQLLQNNNDINLLSSPHILATDNEAAQIDVGQNIPIQSGPQVPGLTSAAGGATAGLGLGLGANVQRQKVGLKLTITPHLNDSDTVRLDAEIHVEDLASENFGGLGASWSTREAKTKIVVRDQEPVVIGGLISEKEVVSESKVPLLGDIPILGYLFKYEQKTRVKTNLIIILTPYIIQDQADLRRIYDKKMRERREFIRSYSAFSDRDFEQDIDYRKKRGLIEEINRTVRSADEDARILREMEASQHRQENAGPVGMPADAPPPARRDDGGAAAGGADE